MEGLSTWLQETYGGEAIDDVASRCTLPGRQELAQLAKPAAFYLESHQNLNYLSAGSFTNYLIRHFGWATYETFYRKSHWLGLGSRFKKCFGVEL